MQPMHSLLYTFVISRLHYINNYTILLGNNDNNDRYIYNITGLTFHSLTVESVYKNVVDVKPKESIA